MTARIYRPAASATQSAPGAGKLWGLDFDPESPRSSAGKPWRLEFEPESPRSIDPLMGWTSSGDMKQQLRLCFNTKEEAVAYAERNGIAYRVEEPRPNLAARRGASYSDNFKTSRVGLWTH